MMNYAQNATKFWNNANPDLPICFQETILVWIPSLYFFLISLIQFLWKCFLNQQFFSYNNEVLDPCWSHETESVELVGIGTKPPIPETGHYSSNCMGCCCFWGLHRLFKITTVDNLRMFFSFLLIGTSLEEFCFVCFIDDKENNALLSSALIKVIVFVLILLVQNWKWCFFPAASYSMSVFWLIFALQSAINSRSILVNVQQYSRYHNLGYVVIKLFGNFSILSQFILSLFSSHDLSDDQRQQSPPINPRLFSSVLSDLTFSWVNKLVWSEFRNPMLALFKTFWVSLLVTSFLKLLVSFLPYLNTLFMSWLLTFIQHSDHTGEPAWHGYFYVFLMIATPMTESFINGRCEMKNGEISIRVKSCITDAIYRKTLRLSTSGRKQFTMGEIANLMSTDTSRLSHFFLIFNDFWSTPFQIAFAMYFLRFQLSWACFAGLFVIILLLPLNSWITSRMRQLTDDAMKAKDKRIRLMNEILSGIKVIKLNAWECLFTEQIKLLRELELSKLKLRLVYQSVLVFIFNAAPVLVTVSSFATYILMDSNNRLTVQSAFVSLALFNQMRVPLNNTPKLISEYSTFVVSLKRVTKFLRCDELDPDSIERINFANITQLNCGAESEFDIVVKNGKFSWCSEPDRESQQFGFVEKIQFKPIQANLEQINLVVPRGKLVAIVGQVGSGKTTLLNALLGNLNKLEGRVLINDSISYVAQQAWIQNETFRDNILYLNPMNEKKFAQIIEACALGPDIAVLSGGVDTEIGEKGINVSGGQKQRIAIARACYAGGSLFLFDDPLSALDAHVGRHIFDQIIGPNGMLNQTTRVLVTHRFSELPECDFIYVLKNGQIVESGTYKQLMERSDGEFAQLFVKPHFCDNQHQEIYTNYLKKPTSHNKSYICDNSRLINDEKNFGNFSVKWSHYYDYMRKLGLLNVALMLTLFGFCSAFNIFASVWLAYWTKSTEQRKESSALASQQVNLTQSSDNFHLDNLPISSNEEMFFLVVYIIINCVLCAFILVATLIVYLVTLRGARLLHNQMLERILRAPLTFFDTNPIGRILNRFTQDLEVCDMVLGTSIRTSLLQVSRLSAALIVVAYEAPYLTVVIILMAILYYAIQRVYITSSRQLRRIESVTRSPIYSHFSETITGANTIRAFGKVEQFVQESHSRIDTNNRSSYAALAISRWLAIRLEFLGYMVVFVNALYFVIMRKETDASSAGLTLSYSLTITRYLSYYILASSNLETNIVSVERCYEYTTTHVEDLFGHLIKYRKAFSPISAGSSTNLIPSDWPTRGQIQFENYSTRYRPDLDLVLNHLNFSIQPNQRVGVVGRTGAGKSSLTLALFRIIERAEGRILIDNQDIAELPLFDLRSRLTIIPQDPVLFTGTLRFNLDPFASHDDSELWSALELTSLKSFVESLGHSLDHQISEGGENLSAGQKQLVCLARALVRRSKVLIMDEATAAVDLETDELIQRTIRNHFVDCTILTIAHRINTIIDYDQVLVLDQGTIAEFDSPQTLLANPHSIFRSLATKAGLFHSYD